MSISRATPTTGCESPWPRGDEHDAAPRAERLGAHRPPWPALLDAIAGAAVVVDRGGRIRATNTEWDHLVGLHGGADATCGVGADYLATCARAAQAGDPEAERVARELTAVLAGTAPAATIDYECPRPEGDQWYRMEVRPLPGGGALVVHHDTTGPQSARRRAERWLAATVERSPEATMVVGPDGRLRYASPAAGRLVGVPPSALVGRHSFEWVHPDDVERVTGAVAGDLLASDAPQPVVLRLRRADGSYRWVEAVPTNMLDDPEVGGVVVNSRDVTDRVLAEERLADQLAILEMVAGDRPVAEILDALARQVEARVDGAHCVISMVTKGRLRHRANPSLRPTFTSATEGREPGPTIGPVGVAASEGAVEVSTDLPGELRWGGFGLLAGAHGLRSCWAAPAVRRADGQVLGAVAVYHPDAVAPSPEQLEHLRNWADVLTVTLERHHDRSRLAHAATHDPLTGVGNRRQLQERLRAALDRTGTSHALIAIDLERFGLVNDTVGHRMGDQLLVRIAGRLAAAIGPDDTLVRLGGDEFAIFAPDHGPSSAVALAERAVAATRHDLWIAQQSVHLAAAAGVVVAAGDRSHADDLLRDADVALQHARRQGSGGIVLYDMTLRHDLQARTWLDAALAGALAADELQLHHQPIVDVRTMTTTATEGLLRWRHDDRSIPPLDFIPRAEATGLIVPIGRWVIDRGVADAAYLAQSRMGRTAPLVALNLSAVQLRDADVVDVVEAALDRHQ
ncbi:MAG TPA: diguanylate cyclase, partial [Acidimicrobiales bacterium]|nr:diguanylate cyclase [Acidimicrobiales bacterium]